MAARARRKPVHGDPAVDEMVMGFIRVANSLDNSVMKNCSSTLLADLDLACHGVSSRAARFQVTRTKQIIGGIKGATIQKDGVH